MTFDEVLKFSRAIEAHDGDVTLAILRQTIC